MSKDSPVSPILPTQTNVVSLANVPSFDAPNSFPACRDLHAYWEALRGPRQMPTRSDFDPRGIEQTLACTFVAEKVAPSVARIRVSGSVMNDVLGMDVRGMPITAFFDPMSREILGESTRDLFASPAMVIVELSARTGFARKPIQARLLLLPMSDAEGQITRIVGCLDIAGGLGKTPRRFHITSLRSEALSGDAPLASPPHIPFAPRGVETPNKSAPTYAFAETPATFRSKRRALHQPAPEKGGLRLVVSND